MSKIGKSPFYEEKSLIGLTPDFKLSIEGLKLQIVLNDNSWLGSKQNGCWYEENS
jgi:hypothetical protein